MERRTYLASAGALATSALAGCGGNGGGGDDSGSGSNASSSLPADTVQCNLVDYAFRPGTDEPLTIDAGTTVHFVWKTANHNIVPKKQPDDANWEGEPKIEGRDHTYDHTFTVPGRYHFVCEPHVNLGMVGDIVVSESSGSSTESP
ncbi:halocyanin [Halarchaeum acidiphilum MH1-52-1]|uniref:Halocyanin n=1 Tax=Halarchaeum acidiphilum MH1-52-1 TaxID=1261545 RepID=U2YUB7_9EURY|nr:plastocyanin/azurin family copper-binding protein [Halarchaeum acidiphilum]GAD52610.1 halocyanin [Halarchaeum acidiphilum MH1-52-1]